MMARVDETIRAKYPKKIWLYETKKATQMPLVHSVAHFVEDGAAVVFRSVVELVPCDFGNGARVTTIPKIYLKKKATRRWLLVN